MILRLRIGVFPVLHNEKRSSLVHHCHLRESLLSHTDWTMEASGGECGVFMGCNIDFGPLECVRIETRDGLAGGLDSGVILCFAGLDFAALSCLLTLVIAHG